ncbi:MAG: ATP-binding protein [Pseudomonadota bacterium]
MVDIADKTAVDEKKSLYWRFNRFLERHLPEGLYPRSLIIIIAPMVLLQAIVVFLFMERHWDSVSTALAKSVAREIGFVSDLYETMPQTQATRDMLENMVRQRLALSLEIRPGEALPAPVAKPFLSLLNFKLSKQITRRVGRPFWLDITGKKDFVDIRVLVGKDTVFRVVTPQSRVYASNYHIFILWMVASSLVLVAVAIIFLRKQIWPIQQLAEAAQSFGMGRDVPDFHPRGAIEVQSAARAVIGMKERIQRHVDQRTTMLAGVSHDLRTILTRFRLQLAFLDDTDQVEELKQDVEEMQNMLEGYMNFVRGDGGEQASLTDVSGMLAVIRDRLEREGADVRFNIQDGIMIEAKAMALSRCFTNLLTNAVKHASRIDVVAAVSKHDLVVTVDDDGPGIAEDKREEVLKPFVRLDAARNQDDSGSGLGLTIALDIARSHGGELVLDDSPLGGLRVQLKLPV